MLNCPSFRAALFQSVESGMGHNVLTPDPTSQHVATTNDSALLLADLVRAVRLDDRVLLFEPLAPPWGCAECLAAYREAWDALGAAGGVTAWLKQFVTRATGAGT
jgi:hypothetical protein